MSDDTQPEVITEENTAPDASPADEEVGGSEENFTTEAGTPEEPASSSDGTDASSSDSTISPSPDSAPSEELETSDPLPLAGPEDSLGAPDASSNAMDSGDAEPTNEPIGGSFKEALNSLKGDHADGEGATHAGTDTPDKLISNPYDVMTGKAIFPEDSHINVPIGLDHFSDASEGEDAEAKLGQAIELLNEVSDSL